MAGRPYKPRAKSFWILVRRLLLRKKRKPPAHPAGEEEKSGLLGSRRSLEDLLVKDGTPEDAASSCDDTKKHGQVLLAVGPHRPVMARSEAAGGGRDGGAAVHRRFVFGGFRRRLLMRQPWRPVLVAIPE